MLCTDLKPKVTTATGAKTGRNRSLLMPACHASLVITLAFTEVTWVTLMDENRRHGHAPGRGTRKGSHVLPTVASKWWRVTAQQTQRELLATS